MSYQHVCEPCRQALHLPAGASYLNRIKREDGGFSTCDTPSVKPRREVMQRDATGKPFIVGFQREDQFFGTNSGCVCHCASNGHNPWQCTGEDQFAIGGRPGSGFVDKLAEQLGIEPIPEMIVSVHEECQALVRVMLAWLQGSTDEERIAIETALEKVRYDDQLRRLRVALLEKLPDLMENPPYRDLKSTSRSWPPSGTKRSHIRGQPARIDSRGPRG